MGTEARSAGTDEGVKRWHGRGHEALTRTSPPYSPTARIAKHRCRRKSPGWPPFIEDRVSVARRCHLAVEGAGVDHLSPSSVMRRGLIRKLVDAGERRN